MPFSRFAAVSCVALLTIEMSGCSPTVTTAASGHSVSATQTTSGKSVPALTTSKLGGGVKGNQRLSVVDQLRNAKIQMFDAMSGFVWGYHNSQFQLYHTSDGGQTWQIVSLPPLPRDTIATQGPGGPGFVEASFMNNSHGWLVWLTDGQAHLFMTTNAGTSWQTADFRVPADASRIGQITLGADKRGWLLLLGDGSTGAAVKYLYQTNNSGVSWKQINSSAEDLPHNGAKTWVAFAPNGHEGILAADNPLNSSITIKITADGGRHWKPTQLTLPATLHDIEKITTKPPMIFADGTAIVSVVVKTATDTSLAVFHLDTKKHWHIVSAKVSQVEAINWTSVHLGTMIVRQNSKLQLLRTADGGRTWLPVGNIPDNLLGDAPTILQWQMTGAKTGWLLSQDAALRPTLLMTTDDGQHWTAL